MAKDQKIIRAKVGLLEFAKLLGNVNQACKMTGYPAATVSLAELDCRKVRLPWLHNHDLD